MNPSPPLRRPIWANWGLFPTLLLIGFLTLGLIGCLLTGVILFGALGGLQYHGMPPTGISMIAIVLYGSALIGSIYAFAARQRLWPLLAMFGAALLIAYGSMRHIARQTLPRDQPKCIEPQTVE